MKFAIGMMVKSTVRYEPTIVGTVVDRIQGSGRQAFQVRTYDGRLIWFDDYELEQVG